MSAESMPPPPPLDPSINPPATDEIDVHFIGTATVLLRVGGFTFLTDPNFLHQGEHAPLGYGLRSKRLTEPAVSIDELPHIDAVILSHHHGDHFDERAARGLDHDLPIVCNQHAAKKLTAQGFRVLRSLETWESTEFASGDHSVRITALPGRHAPQPLDRLLPPVMGTMVEALRGEETLARIYISGDTLIHDRLREIPARFPEIDLGLLHLGGTRVLGVTLTMDGAAGVEALRIVRPAHAVPIHYDDYTVFKSPLSDFTDAVAAAEDVMTQVHYVERGGSLRLRADERGLFVEATEGAEGPS